MVDMHMHTLYSDGDKTVEEVLKICEEKRLEYINKIDAELNCQRIYLRIMYKNKWINDKKFNVSITKVGEIGKIVGGLIKYYVKNNKE